MPELPEVENIKRGLQVLRGQKIMKVSVLLPQTVFGRSNIRQASIKKAREFENELKGEVVLSVERRGKNLIFKMKNGKILVSHLKMTGQFIYDPTRKIEPTKHARIIFELSKGRLFFNDIRRFGYVIYYPSEKYLEESGHFNDIGLEPFDSELTPEFLEAEFKKRKTNVKTLLMSQKVVAGLGNIYVDEACFAAGVKPTRRTEDLNSKEIKKLHDSIRKILTNAIELGGSSIRNYKLASGKEGSFVKMHQVYGKYGEPCPKCKNKLEKMVIGGRTTIFCKNCQK